MATLARFNFEQRLGLQAPLSNTFFSVIKWSPSLCKKQETREENFLYLTVQPVHSLEGMVQGADQAAWLTCSALLSNRTETWTGRGAVSSASLSTKSQALPPAFQTHDWENVSETFYHQKRKQIIPSLCHVQGLIYYKIFK